VKLKFLERMLNNSRVPGRLLVLVMLILRLPTRGLRRSRPVTPRNILVLHHLLLGDTIMLAGLLAKLRHGFPDAALRLATPPGTVPLFAGRPYGVDAYPLNPKSLSSMLALFRLPRPDLVIIPAENRYSPLAAGLGARWVVGFEGDAPAWKNCLFDELRPYPATPTAWPDMAASLVDGPPPKPFHIEDWPAPACHDFSLPPKPYCVLHVGASSSLRHWMPERWHDLAAWLDTRGYAIVWSGGPGEENLVQQCDPERRYISLAGKLDLAQLWHLLAEAALLVSPDTGIAHLGKATGTPSVTLFGPGSAIIYGPGQFWRQHPYRAVTIEEFPCRDGRMLFERTSVPWVRHCARPTSACAKPLCMEALTLAAVKDSVLALLPALTTEQPGSPVP